MLKLLNILYISQFQYCPPSPRKTKTIPLKTEYIITVQLNKRISKHFSQF